MTTKTSTARWTRVLDGWYSLNLRTAGRLVHMEVIRNDLGLWSVKVDEAEVGMTDKLASAKRIALAAA